jgi:D-glycero-D-manno-heptose 1,7-bisphosphate phosphatase
LEPEIGPSSANSSGAALFLDRDGTLIVDKHYLSEPAGVEIIPGVPEALERARTLGYHLFLFTNQSGIARGLYALDDVLRCNARMEELLGLSQPIFTDICIATEGPEDPQHYRKPSPRFILESISRHGLDRHRCWMVGDRDSDIDAGLNAEIRAAAVCTGKYDLATWSGRARPGVPVFPSLQAFVASLPPAGRSASPTPTVQLPANGRE